jgi:integrase/recombinase XerD
MMSERAQDALTQEQLECLLDSINTRSPSGKRNLALLTLLGDLGLRIGEALGLQMRDLVSEHGQFMAIKLRTRKCGNAQTLDLPRRTAARLAAWLEARAALGLADRGAGGGAVFCTISRGQRVHPTQDGDGFSTQTTTTELQPGQPLSDSYARQLVARLAQRAEIEQRVTPHTLRHTAATLMLRNGVPLPVVSAMLGHKSVRTTAEIYSHITSRDVLNAVEALHERLRDRDE